MSTKTSHRRAARKSIWNVPYVYADEATPRDEHVAIVEAPTAADAAADVQIRSILRGDRILTAPAWR